MTSKKCKGCGIKQDHTRLGKIFLTQDGYCTRCNVRHKDRPRIKPIFQFKSKDVENKHLDSTGRKLTKSRIMSYNNPNPSDYRKAKNANKRRITEFL